MDRPDLVDQPTSPRIALIARRRQHSLEIVAIFAEGTQLCHLPTVDKSKIPVLDGETFAKRAIEKMPKSPKNGPCE
jgi:hypothetical protein